MPDLFAQPAANIISNELAHALHPEHENELDALVKFFGNFGLKSVRFPYHHIMNSYSNSKLGLLKVPIEI